MDSDSASPCEIFGSRIIRSHYRAYSPATTAKQCAPQRIYFPSSLCVCTGTYVQTTKRLSYTNESRNTPQRIYLRISLPQKLLGCADRVPGDDD
jgi:hypothetical protein